MFEQFYILYWSHCTYKSTREKITVDQSTCPLVGSANHLLLMSLVFVATALIAVHACLNKHKIHKKQFYLYLLNYNILKENKYILLTKLKTYQKYANLMAISS